MSFSGGGVELIKLFYWDITQMQFNFCLNFYQPLMLWWFLNFEACEDWALINKEKNT